MNHSKNQYDELIQLLLPSQQTHLLNYWNELKEDEQSTFYRQLMAINFETFIIQRQLINENLTELIPFSPFKEFYSVGDKENNQLGKQLIAQGEMGCLLIAGGQGSRLRFDGPKGMFPVTSVEHKTLFQLFAERVLAVGNACGRRLPVAIMTSEINYEETVNYFKTNHLFGLNTDDVDFFSQKMLPLLDTQGNLFLEDKGKLAEGPDGNGGSLFHFYQAGIWQKWADRGVKYLNYVLIDNALADPFDADLLGFHSRLQNEITVKCTMKTDPNEKVGVLAKHDEKVVIIEYSEMSEEERERRNERGELSYTCANLSLFCFSLDFIKKMVTQSFTLPLHKAFKAVKFLNAEGKTVKNEKSNAWKFEQFIFDVLPLSNKICALLYPRERCFAPLKNFEGVDSLETVQKALQKRDQTVFTEVTGLPCELEPFELAPQFYYPTAALRKKWIGKSVNTPGYLEE